MMQAGERGGEVVVQAETGELVFIEFVEFIGLVHGGLVDVEFSIGDRGSDVGGELLMPFLVSPLESRLEARRRGKGVQDASHRACPFSEALAAVAEFLASVFH